MEKTIQRMTQEIDEALGHGLHSLWLYGSVVLGNFHLGWSDIDFIAFTNEPIKEEQAKKLLTLRQDLSARCPGNPYYRCFEGVIVSLDEYRAGQYTRLVYWGTSGQRVTARWTMDVFSRFELSKYGRLVYGEREGDLFSMPTRVELVEGVRKHYAGIRQCALQTDESFYSCGWLLDIARCLYTLRHGDVIGKTQAGEWALKEHLFPEEEALQRTLMIRRDPLTYKDRPEVKAWLRALGPTVQRYADVLETELERNR